MILLVENKLYIVKLIGTLSIKYLLMYYQELIMGLDITPGVIKCGSASVDEECRKWEL